MTSKQGCVCGCATCTAKRLMIRRAPGSISCSVVIILKLIIIFSQGASCFHNFIRLCKIGSWSCLSKAILVVTMDFFFSHLLSRSWMISWTYLVTESPSAVAMGQGTDLNFTVSGVSGPVVSAHGVSAEVPYWAEHTESSWWQRVACPVNYNQLLGTASAPASLSLCECYHYMDRRQHVSNLFVQKGDEDSGRSWS